MLNKMKPKEYIKKYNLSSNDNFNHDDFILDFTSDFIAELQYSKGDKSYKGFNNCVNVMRMKWDAISNKKPFGMPEKLWNYFYATVIIKFKADFFPEIVEEENKAKLEREAYKADKERRKKERENFFRATFEDYYRARLNALAAFLNEISVPNEAFILLGLTKDCTIDEVKSSYRKLAIKHHPDKGGKKEDFIKYNEAYNKCLAYLHSKSKKAS